MPHGPGKYDDAATVARITTGAAGVVLIVFGGQQGHGFSVQVPPETLVDLPEWLRTMADQIEADLKEGTPP